MASEKFEGYRLNKYHKALLETIPKSWMLRECSVYKDEYKGCSGIKGKIHSYYLTGKIDPCDNWKQNYEDCQLWVENSDTDAAKRVIHREEKRIYNRLKDHYDNDVWESRSPEERPPKDWNKPLPEHLADLSEDSYLKLYKQNLENENPEISRVLTLRKYTPSIKMGERYNIHSQLEHLQSKYIGTGHADTSKYEWLTNQHRDSCASYMGHFDLINYFSLAENESKARVKFNLMEKMLQPCGPPPEKKSED